MDGVLLELEVKMAKFRVDLQIAVAAPGSWAD
jgi:hypothetical protein